MSTDLKGCPFCGGEPYQHQIGNDRTKGRGFDVGCKSCRFKISDRVLRHSLEWCKEINAKNWNTRASPDPAGVTLTLEEIAATIRAKFVENWKCSELGSAWDEDVLLTGCRKVGNGKGYQNPEEAAQNLATDAATAILSLIQSKMGKP